MLEIEISLIIASFIAGILMFLAPCTLPLVPAFLAFISGTKVTENTITKKQNRKIIKNSIFYSLGFSVVFIAFGLLFGFLGRYIIEFRSVLSQVGGVLIIFFGLTMLGVGNIGFLRRNYTLKIPGALSPGNPGSSFLMGSIFALGWTPCVGPVFASVLILASTPGNIFSGGILLGVFSLGLAIPFILVAVLYSKSAKTIEKYAYISQSFNFIGGLFLIGIGVLLLSGNFIWTVEYGYKLFNWLGISGLFNYL